MSGHGRPLGALAPMSGVRPRRLLRFVEEQARHQALSRRASSGHPLVRAGRAMAVVLCRRADRRDVTTSEPLAKITPDQSPKYLPFCAPESETGGTRAQRRAPSDWSCECVHVHLTELR